MIYVSPPFGNYIRLRGQSVSIHGSFTYLPRPGRLGQIVRTVRPVPGGWINSIGLRNPGIRHPGVLTKSVDALSLAGIQDNDWLKMAEYLQLFDLRDRLSSKSLPIELNLSCPNVQEYGPPSRVELEKFLLQPGVLVRAKLPPTDHAEKLADVCAEAGIKWLHFSNTLPSPIGGISGDPLRAVNLPLVEAMAKKFQSTEVRLIAGGGIYLPEHAQAYLNAGASQLSLATVFFNPLRARRLLKWLRGKELL